jgi:hypothetical protein
MSAVPSMRTGGADAQDVDAMAQPSAIAHEQSRVFNMFCSCSADLSSRSALPHTKHDPYRRRTIADIHRPISRSKSVRGRSTWRAGGQALAASVIVTTLRNLGLLAIALGAVLAVLVGRSPRRRAPGARKLAHMRRFASHRVVDRDDVHSQALDTWDDDGGAKQGGPDATIR